MLDRMLDRAHYFIVSVGDGAGNSYCAKTFTTKDGHKLPALRGKSEPGGGHGNGHDPRWDGTVLRHEKFNFVAVTDRVFWDDIEWEWETP